MLRPFSLRLCLVTIQGSIFLSSCVFNSDEEFFKDIAKPDPAAVSVHINTIDLVEHNPGDTIDLFGTTLFYFSLTGELGALELTTVFLDGEEVASVDANGFIVYISQLKDGIYPLQFDMIMSSGSGSLADAVGSEKLNVTLKWIVRVDLSPPPQPTPTLDIIDGFLTLQWPAYSRPNFRSYVVKRRLASGASRSFEIKDKRIGSWRDSSYVGGYPSPITYSLSIVAETGTVTSEPVSRADPLDYSFAFNSLDSTFTLKWTATKFYGTFNGYKVGLESGYDVTLLTDFSDSTYSNRLSTIRFGGDSFVSISIQSISEDIPEGLKWSSCKIGTPLPFTPVGNIAFNTYLNSLVALDADKNLIKVDDQLEPAGIVTSLRGTSWRMPYPGNFVYTISADYSNKNIYRSDLENDSEVAYNYFYLRNQSSINTVASNGLICVDWLRLPVGPPTNLPPLWVIGAIDAASTETGSNYVFYESSNTTNLSAVISEDGKFIWANGNRVFKMSGSTSELIGSFTPLGSFIQFRPDNSSEIMFRDGNAINFYDANALSLIRSINPPASLVYWNDMSYDVQTKNMLWKGLGASTRLYMVNIETGVTRSIQISTKATPDDFYMLGDVLIYKGTYIRVD